MTNEQTVYFMGGPADLSKRVLPNVRNGDIYHVPVMPRYNAINASEEMPNMTVRIEDYLIRRIEKDLWIAVHEPSD